MSATDAADGCDECGEPVGILDARRPAQDRKRRLCGRCYREVLSDD